MKVKIKPPKSYKIIKNKFYEKLMGFFNLNIIIIKRLKIIYSNNDFH